VILRTETWIRTTPDEIARFFDGLEENYTRWHPDHHAFTWIEGQGLPEGAVRRFVDEHRLRAVRHDHESDTFLECVPISLPDGPTVAVDTEIPVSLYFEKDQRPSFRPDPDIDAEIKCAVSLVLTSHTRIIPLSST
jgi:hypothetical protein